MKCKMESKDLGQSIKDMVVLYEKAKRFLTPKDKIELAEKVKDLTEFLEDLIW